MIDGNVIGSGIFPELKIFHFMKKNKKPPKKRRSEAKRFQRVMNPNKAGSTNASRRFNFPRITLDDCLKVATIVKIISDIF